MSNTSRNLGISFLLSKKHAHRNDGHGVSVRKTVMASVFLSATLLTVPSAFAAPAANALPTNGQVVAGQANISQSGNVMNINQSTQRAVINWDSFNVGKNATVNFNQPNANSSTLNRVNGASQSMINGAVNANGQVIFVNPNGVVFGKGAEVNTGGLVATTMNIKDSDYMSGKMIFSGGESGKVINKGTITANGVNGYIALMAPEVKNQGVLIANISNSNTIALVSGTKVTLSFDGSQLTNITVDASAINSLITNKHAITTNGGQIIIAANAASNLKASVINNTGTINSDSITTSGGKVFLTAGTVNQSGTVSANSAESDGGNVTISGNQVNLNTASKTSATGATAGGQILIGKTTQNAAQSQVNASNVTVSQGALVDASATQNGNGGSIQVWSTISTSIAGLFKANGGAMAGNGGNIDTSSAGTVTYGKGLVVDTTAPKGKTGNWLTDPLSIIIDSTAATILSNALLTTNVILDATASSCAGIGNCTTSSVPLIQFLAGTSVYSTANTALTLNATGGTITMDGSIAVGQVYAVAQTINVNGSLNTTASSNGSIYLAGAIINILGNINSNGNSSNNSSSSNLTSANIITANNRRNGVNGSNSQSNSTSALNADDTTYTSNGGAINIIASGDINIGSSSISSATNNSSYISANGQNGGTINIVSVNGNINNQGIVDALGKTSTGGTVIIAAKNTNTFTGGLISSDGYSQAGVIQIGVANSIGSGSTLAPPSINSQVATVLAAVNFTPSSSSSILTSNTALDNATVITANSAASTSQVTLNSQAGQIYIAGNNSLNTAATIQANADTGGLIILSSPAGAYQNTGYIQTNGGAGLGGTIAQSGLISTALTGATVEANGTLGGGNIILGRDFKTNPLSGSATQDALLPNLSSVITVPTSASTTVDANSSLSANSTVSGDGGNVLVWGDMLGAYGRINVNGGASSGNGGFIETSGSYLDVSGIRVSATSQGSQGIMGTWLLDPYDVTITSTATAGTSFPFTASSTSTILNTDIQTALASASVIISTGISGGVVNNISVNAPVSWSAATTLTLWSNNNIYINAAINASATSGAGVLLKYNWVNQGGIYDFGLSSTGFAGSITFGGTADSYSTVNYHTTTNYTLISNPLSTATGGFVSSSTNYALISNYTSSWSGAGSPISSYSANFDGLGHSITGMALTGNGSTGWIGSMDAINTGVISNIAFINPSLSGASGGNGSGIVAGYIKGSVLNVYVSGATVTCSSACGNLGGVIGYGNSSGLGGLFSNIYFVNGVVGGTTSQYSSAYVGGIVGYSYSDLGYAYVISSTISGAGTLGYGAGGIAGVANSNISFSSVANSTIKTNGASGAGGLIGYDIYYPTTTSNSVTNSSIIALTSSGYAGGIVGYEGSIAAKSDLISRYLSNSITGSTITTVTAANGASLFGSGSIANGPSQSNYTNKVVGSNTASTTCVNLVCTDLIDYFAAGQTGSFSSSANWSLGYAPTTANINSHSITIIQINAGSTVNFDTSDTTNLTATSGSPYSLPIAIASGSSINFINSGNATLSGVISGLGSITQAGSGSVTLSGANTYTGTTTVNGGTLTAGVSTSGSTGAFGYGSNVTVNGGTLALGSYNETVGSVTIGNSGGSITGSGTLTATSYAFTNTSSNAATISAILAGSGASLTQSGAGTTTLSGANTYTGGTTISGGILKTGSATALGGSAGTVTVASGAALDLNGQTLTNTNPLTLNGTGISSGGALTNSSATAGTYAGLITLGSASSINASSGNIVISNTGTITGATYGLTLTGTNTASSIASIIGTTSGALTKSGTGTWTLSGANTYTGGTTISAGTLVASTSASALGSSTVTLGDSSGSANATLQVATTGLTYSNPIVLSSGTSGTLTIGNTGTASTTFSGGVTGSNNLVISEGASSGTITFATGSLNNTGTITNSGSGSGTTTISAAVGSNVTGIAESSSNSALTLSGAITTAGTTFTNSGTNTLTISGGISGTGTGNVIFNNNSSGTITVSTTSINNTGTITNSGSGTGTTTISAAVGSNVTGVIENGTSPLTLSGSNGSFTGSTTITAGTINAGSGNALGTGAVGIGSSGILNLTYTGTVALGSTLSMSTGAAITNSANTSSLSVAGTSTLNGNINTAGNQTYTGAVTLGANTTLTTLNTSSVNTNGTITFGSTVDSTAGSYYGLSVTNGTGTTAFGGVVGANSGTSALGYLCINSSGCSASAVGTTTGNGTTTLAGSVTTSGTQTYGGNLFLYGSAGINLTSTNSPVTVAGNISTDIHILQLLGAGAYISNGVTYANTGGASYTNLVLSNNNGLLTWNGTNYSWAPSTQISSLSASLLLVAGGGSGGTYGGGGGGGGGIIYVSSFSLGTATSYSTTIGAGGINSNGGNTLFGSTYTAIGGGKGGGYNSAGNSGGAGGGGAFNSSGGAGTSGQGNAGGSGVSGGTSNGGNGGTGNDLAGGGGGTADGANHAGSGGNGFYTNISGTYTYYAGGGGGSNATSTYNASGGFGGGGTGAAGGSTGMTAGTSNTGGGGGGQYTGSSGANGGSGIVIINTLGPALTINSGTGKSSIGGTVSNVTTLTINSTAATSAVTGSIGGSTAVAYNTASGYTGSNGAAGVLSLAGTNTYTGGTTVTGGTLQAGSVAAFGGATSAITVNTGAALDLNGKTLTYANALTLNGSGISNGGALTNSSATGGTYIGAITLGSDSLIGSTAGAITVSGAIASSGSAYNLALVGSKAITLSSATNTLSTIASGSGLGALSITNNQALIIGSMTIGGTTYSGLSSTGTILVQTSTGNLTVNNAVTTSSTSAVTSAPAIKLAAGYNGTTSDTAYNIILGSSSSSLITAGSGAIIALYSGTPTSSTNLSAFTAGQTTNFITYSKTTSDTQSATSGYYLKYRGTIPSLYVIFGSSDTPTYGSAPTITYSFNTLANGSGTSYLSSDTSTVNATGTAVFTGTNSTTATTGVSLNSSANAGSYTAVAYSSGLSSLVYAISAGSSTGSLTINKANAYVIVTSGQSSTYGATPTINYTFNTNSAGTGSVISASPTGLSGTATITNTPTSSSNAGTYNLTYASGLSSTNYAFNAAASSVSYAVNQAQAYVIIAPSQSSTYGATPTINYTFNTNSAGTGSAISSSPTGLSGTATITNAPTSSSNAGTYSLTYASGLSSTNYAFNAAASSVSYAVNQAQAYVIITSGQSSTYGATPTINYTFNTNSAGTGSAISSSPTGLSGTATITNAPTSSSNAGTYSLTYASGLSSTNYAFNAAASSRSYTVNPAVLNIAAISKTYDGTTTFTNANAYTLSGTRYNGDAMPTIVSGTATTSSANAATYTSFASNGLTLSSGNYTLTGGTVAATINQAPLGIVIGGVYSGSTTIAPTSYTVTGLVSVSGTAQTLVPTSVTVNDANVSTNGANYVTAINSKTGTANLSNYAITTAYNGTSGTTTTNAVALTGAPLGLTVTGIYNGLYSITPNSVLPTGLLNSQTLTGLSSVTLSSKDVASNGSNYVISASGVTGTANLANYVITAAYNSASTSTQNVATLSAAPLGISVTGSYSGSTVIAPTTVTATGLVNGETLTGLTSATLSSANVSANGSNYVSAISGPTGTATLSNYSITTAYNASAGTSLNTATITPAVLTVTAVPSQKFVTESDPTGYGGVIYSGWVAGQGTSVLNTTGLTISRSTPTVNTAGSNYTLTPGGIAANGGNYTFSYQAGNFTIVPADTLAIVVANNATSYGTAPSYSITSARYLNSANNTIYTLSPTVTGSVVTMSDGSGGSVAFTLTPVSTTGTSTITSGSGNYKVDSYTLSATNKTIVSNNFSNSITVSGALTVSSLGINPSNITVAGLSKTYDGTTNVSGLTLNASSTSFKTGDTVSVTGSGNFADTNVGTGKSITITPALTGADSANYYLTGSGTINTTGAILQLASVTYTGSSGGSWSNSANWAGGAIPTLSNVATVIIPTTKTVVYDAANLTSLTPTSAITTNGTLSFTGSTATTFVNTVSGTGSISQSGTGALTLTGTNAYSGGTNLGAGSSLIAGSSSALGTGTLNSSGGTFGTSVVTLPSLTVNGAVILASDITSSGNQTYNGAVTINNPANTTTLSSSAGNITFGSTLNASATNQSLVLSAAAGQVTFNGQVGVATQTYNTGTQSYSPTTYASYQSQSSNNLSNLTVSANTINLNADISTRLTQIYNGSLLVGDNGSNGPTRVLLSEDPAITFNGTINDTVAGTHNLFVKAVTIANEAPSIIFNDVVGGIAALKSLTASTGAQDAATGALYSAIDTTPANLVGTVTIKENVSTTGDQTYTAKGFTLGNGTANQTLSLTTQTGNIAFNAGSSGGSGFTPAGSGLIVSIFNSGGTVSGLSGSGLNYSVTDTTASASSSSTTSTSNLTSAQYSTGGALQNSFNNEFTQLASEIMYDQSGGSVTVGSPSEACVLRYEASYLSCVQ
ncbi:filamentous hemagglutinin N-terminal domain-containing protein [Polynucleobacter paneuropaeus]|nr:filamentous hemagglutinin N-terminal domain-containing protein [Polynucleobacter paneuropaeus]